MIKGDIAGEFSKISYTLSLDVLWIHGSLAHFDDIQHAPAHTSHTKKWNVAQIDPPCWQPLEFCPWSSDVIWYDILLYSIVFYYSILYSILLYGGNTLRVLLFGSDIMSLSQSNVCSSSRLKPKSEFPTDVEAKPRHNTCQIKCKLVIAGKCVMRNMVMTPATVLISRPFAKFKGRLSTRLRVAAAIVAPLNRQWLRRLETLEPQSLCMKQAWD